MLILICVLHCILIIVAPRASCLNHLRLQLRWALVWRCLCHLLLGNMTLVSSYNFAIIIRHLLWYRTFSLRNLPSINQLLSNSLWFLEYARILACSVVLRGSNDFHSAVLVLQLILASGFCHLLLWGHACIFLFFSLYSPLSTDKDHTHTHEVCDRIASVNWQIIASLLLVFFFSPNLTTFLVSNFFCRLLDSRVPCHSKEALIGWRQRFSIRDFFYLILAQIFLVLFLNCAFHSGH